MSGNWGDHLLERLILILVLAFQQFWDVWKKKKNVAELEYFVVLDDVVFWNLFILGYINGGFADV